MKLMIDINIILDVVFRRQDLYQQSAAVLDMCTRKKVEGFVTASSVTDFFYLIRKITKSSDAAYECMEHLFAIVKVLPVTSENVMTAYNMKARDFEDCLLAVCAKENGCAAIVTRNAKDFKDFDICTVSPDSMDKLLLGEM